MAVNPKSLKNLKPFEGSELARELQKKSVEARRINKEARERAEERAKETALMAKLLDDQGVSSLDRLKVIAEMHLDNGDIDSAADILKSIAEYEQPKLARVDQTITDGGVEELSDEDLAKLIKEASEDLE